MNSAGLWIELRNRENKLCARLNPEQWLLEIRRNQFTEIFDLRRYLEKLIIDEAADLLYSEDN